MSEHDEANLLPDEEELPHKNQEEEENPSSLPKLPKQLRSAQDGYSRRNRSLSLLCEHFLAQFCREPDYMILIDTAAQSLQVERRRIYDILNVLDAFSMVEKHLKGQYVFKGVDALRQKLGTLLVEAQQELHSLPQTDDASDDKQERSMSRLSQRFAQMFMLTQNKTLELEKAAAALLGSSEEKGKTRTRVRRLYDIANIMSAMGIIEKSPSQETGKTWFIWHGADGMETKLSTLEMPPQLPPPAAATAPTANTTAASNQFIGTAGIPVIVPGIVPAGLVGMDALNLHALNTLGMNAGGATNEDGAGIAAANALFLQALGSMNTALPLQLNLDILNGTAATTAAVNGMNGGIPGMPAPTLLMDGTVLTPEIAAHMMNMQPFLLNFGMTPENFAALGSIDPLNAIQQPVQQPSVQQPSVQELISNGTGNDEVADDANKTLGGVKRSREEEEEEEKEGKEGKEVKENADRVDNEDGHIDKKALTMIDQSQATQSIEPQHSDPTTTNNTPADTSIPKDATNIKNDNVEELKNESDPRNKLNPLQRFVQINHGSKATNISSGKKKLSTPSLLPASPPLVGTTTAHLNVPVVSNSATTTNTTSNAVWPNAWSGMMNTDLTGMLPSLWPGVFQTGTPLNIPAISPTTAAMSNDAMLANQQAYTSMFAQYFSIMQQQTPGGVGVVDNNNNNNNEDDKKNTANDNNNNNNNNNNNTSVQQVDAVTNESQQPEQEQEEHLK